MTDTCKVDGCSNPVFVHGICQVHNRRLKLQGSIHAEKWGTAAKHPLYDSWSWLKRAYRSSGDLDHSWHDFWNFVADVGERPHHSTLRRIDENKPWSKENFRWKEGNMDIPLSDRESRNQYARYWYAKATPEYKKSKDLKKLYGITLDDFNRMADAQEHKCAICKQPEGAIDRFSGKPRKLAVDHCHATDKVRGLLCSRCNTAIGSLNDDPSLFRMAAEYIENHR